MSDLPTDYERVSIYPVDPDVLEKLLATQDTFTLSLLPGQPGTEGLLTDPPKANLRNNHLGYAILEAGEDVEEALKLIARASALRPEDAAITDSLGWGLFRHGQVDQAITILETAYASDPTISELGEHLGDAYWAAGRRVEARYVWRGAALYADAPAISARLDRKIDLGPDLINVGPQ